jgi:hypothetical protein
MTSRPGRVRDIHRVALSRPRTLAVMDDATYLAVCRELRDLLLPADAAA